MTCIVGLKTKDKIFIAGDSMGSNGFNHTIRKDPKVFKNGEYIMGYTSSFRMGQILQYNFIPPKIKIPSKKEKFSFFNKNKNENKEKYWNNDPTGFMCTQFIPKLQQCLIENKWVRGKNDTISGGQFLVAAYNQLFEIDCDFQVARVDLPYCAVGCGQTVAEGAMGMGIKLLKNKELRPRELLKNAIDIASSHVSGVGGPVTCIST